MNKLSALFLFTSIFSFAPTFAHAQTTAPAVGTPWSCLAICSGLNQNHSRICASAGKGLSDAVDALTKKTVANGECSGCGSDDLSVAICRDAQGNNPHLYAQAKAQQAHAHP
jgi:hypothetical protein